MDQDGQQIMKKKKKIKSKNRILPTSLNSGVKMNETTNSCNSIREKKIKLKAKLKNLNENVESDKTTDELCQEAAEKHSSPKLKKNKKKKKKKRKIDTETKGDSSNDDLDTVDEPTKKKKKLQPKNEEYKPGMLSDCLQMKKYGRVILPWDPSFGLDTKYSGKSRNEEDGSSEPKLNINPLFDLSKRTPVSLSEEAGSTFFIGNLPSNTRVMEIKKLFAKYGIIYKVKLKQKKMWTPKQSDENEGVATESETVNAIIKFKTLKSSEAVLSMNGTLYKDHHLRVNLSKDEPKIEKEKSVFVGNLAFSAKDDILWEAFENCGEIESVRIIRDDRSGKGRGFGYVNFKSADSVEAALKLDGTLVLNRELRVMSNNSRAVSLSNLITVKRKKIHKKRKPLTKDTCTDTVVKKLKKIKKISHKSSVDTEGQRELLTSTENDSIMKKKKKKKKTNEATN